MKKNFFNNIYFTLFCILMLLLNIFIGPSLKASLTLLLTYINLLSIIYLLYNYKKNKYILNKLDVFVILFLLSSIIPLIFKNYISLSGTYRTIMESICVLLIYFLVKNLSLNNKNKIINIIIFSTIPILIIGFDRLYSNYIWEFLYKNFDVFRINYNESVFQANFNYPNSLAIYLSSITILTLGQFLKDNTKLNKTIYISYIFLLILAIILTQSKATFVLFAVFLIIYIVLLRNNADRKIIINIILISLFTISLYFILFNLFGTTIILKILVLIIYIVVSILLSYLSKKIRFKTCIITTFVTVIFFTTIILVLTNYSKPAYLYFPQIYSFKRIEIKDNYKINIDLTTQSNLENNVKISIFSVDENGYKTRIVTDEFNNFSGMKEYYLENLKDLKYIDIKFENKNRNTKDKLKVNKVFIDDKEYIINYKYIPNQLGNLVNSFSISDPNIKSRLDYYKDSFKIIKENWLFGKGGSSWRYLYKTIQSYSYSAAEVHNYLLDVFMNFGIFGIMFLIFIIIYLLKFSYNVLKNITSKEYKTYLSIIISLFLLLAHSLFDFNMSFLLVNIYFFILIALISNTKTKEHKINKYINLPIIIIILISLFFNLSNSVGNIMYKNKIKKNEENTNKFIQIAKLYPTNIQIKHKNLLLIKQNLNTTIDKEGYNQIQDEYIKYLIDFLNEEPYYNQKYFLNLLKEETINSVKNDTFDENNINGLYEILKQFKLEDKYNIDLMINKVKIMKELNKVYLEYGEKYNNKFLINEANKIEKLLIAEYEINLSNLENYKNTKYSKKIYEKLLKLYQNEIKK